MRISDWSSDVCSSDLNRVRVVDEEQEDVAIGRIERRRVAADVDIGIIVHVRPVEHAWNLPPGLPDAISGDLHHRSDEIGRASCRERVCQYVEISVVAVSLKKKNNNITQQIPHNTKTHT